MSRADLLRAKRSEAAARADELQCALDRYPHREIRRELERWARLVNAYDRTLAEMST